MLEALFYTKEHGLVRSREPEAVAAALKQPRCLTWVDITNPDEGDIDLLVETFAFHPLAIEDAIFPQNHPKLDDYDDYLFVVIHELDATPGEGKPVGTHELDLFVGKNYVVTLHAEPVLSVTGLLNRCKDKPLAMQQGAGFLLHAILDRAVDASFPVVERLEDRIAEVEEDTLAHAEPKVLERIVRLKKDVLLLRNILAPQRKLVAQMTRATTPLLRPATQAYFRDVYDHIERINNLLDTFRDLLSSTMEVYLSAVSQRLNEIMKTLTIIATFMMPLTLITSFYGMNVKAPEFGWGIRGYWFVVGLLVLSVGVMIWFLKRRKWI
jgi:magnesium transporter